MTERTNPDDPAFPRPASEDKELGSLHAGDVPVEAQTGLTIRQFYAGQALAAGAVGIDAVKRADDLIRALNATPTP